MRLPAVPFGFAARVAAFYVAICGVIGVQLPFFPLWLKAKGLDPQMIGIVLAVPMVVRIAAIPLAARMADRNDSLRGVILACAMATLLGYTLLAFAEGTVAVLAAFALASATNTPMMPLAETYALKGLAARKRAYGPVRVWGSAAFVAGTFAAGLAADLIVARDLIWLIVVAVLLNVVSAYALEPLSLPHTAEPRAAQRRLIRDPAFIAVLAAASLIQASHAVYYGFSTLDWSRAGLDGTAIAALWALGVVAEIVLFALQGRLPPFLSPGVLLIVGGCGGAVRWLAMAFDPAILLLPWLQLLHGLSFGATHLGAIGLVAQRAPAGKGAAAQGHLAIALGLAMAASMSLSGWLYAAYGNRAYAVMALIAAAGGACAFVANKLRRGAAV
jgi:PPP family 3-phenylpropionic acid transporter